MERTAATSIAEGAFRRRLDVGRRRLHSSLREQRSSLGIHDILLRAARSFINQANNAIHFERLEYGRGGDRRVGSVVDTRLLHRWLAA